MLKRFQRLAAVTVSLVALAVWCQASNFSADTVTKQGKMTMTGKIYVQGQKMRQEMTMGPQKSIVILRPDKKVVWMIHPAQKTYMEMKVKGNEDLSPTRGLSELKKRAVEKKLGRETVNGVVCEKSRFEFRDKKMGTVTQCFSKELGYPVKVVTLRGSNSALMELKNIKRATPANSLFEVPKGYKKASMPAGMSGMPGGSKPPMRGAPGMPH